MAKPMIRSILLATDKGLERDAHIPAILARRVVAIFAAAGAFFMVAGYPTAPLAIGALLGLYVLLSLRVADAWLVVVPALLPLLYLAPWSGRIFLDEFDALLLCTLAVALWHGRWRLQGLGITGAGRGILLLFSGLYVHAVWRGLAGLTQLDFNALASYYSPLNALRIGKGFLWAMLLSPVWINSHRANPERSIRLLTLGIMVGMLGLFIIVLWERGVAHDLVYYQNRYQLIGSLLNFSTPYRITGLFAEMHTGGEAIDGYLGLVWPFAVFALITARSRSGLIFAAMAMLATLYAMVVTFSRGVYFGFAVTTCVAGLLRYLQDRKHVSIPLAAFTLTCIGIAGTMAVFALRAGGVIAVGASLATFGIGACCVFAREQRRLNGAWLAIALASVASFAAVAAYAAATSKWTKFDALEGMGLSACSAVAFALIGAGLNHGWQPHSGVRNRALMSLLLCGVLAAFVPSLFGSRMEQRFATASGDLQNRVRHWNDAIAIMDDNWQTRLLGQGIGRFPERYYWVKQQAKDVGSFVFLRKDGNTFCNLRGQRTCAWGNAWRCSRTRTTPCRWT